MVSPAYKACPTFVSSLQATCQLSRSCTTLLSSGGFSVWFALSMPSCLFSVRFFHSLPLFLLLTLSFTGFPIARARASKDKDYIIYVLLDETLRSTLPPTAVYFSVTEKDLGKVADGIKKKVDQPSQSSAASPQKPILPIDSTTPGVTPISINIDTSDASQKTKDEWLKAGDEADDAGQYQDALDAYEKAIKCDDKDPRGYRGKSKALKRLGRACEAEDAEEEAERLEKEQQEKS